MENYTLEVLAVPLVDLVKFVLVGGSTQDFFLLLVGDYWVIVSGAEGQRALGKGKDTKVPEPLPAPSKWG